MEEPPDIDIASIERRVGQRGFRRGRDYYLSGAVFKTRFQGAVIKASCSGKSMLPYEVRVDLDPENGIVDARCTCPVGSGGTCKHIAALLIAWYEDPDDFLEVEMLETTFERLSREDLIELLKQLLARRADLEGLIEGMLPEATKSDKAETPISPSAYRRQAAELLAPPKAGSKVDPATRLEKLRVIKQKADTYAVQREMKSAVEIYRTFIDAYHAADATMPDGLDELVEQCVAALGRVLVDWTDDPDTRKSVLRSLIDVYQNHLVENETVRTDIAELLLDHTNEQEQQEIAVWLRQMIDGCESAFVRRTLGGLLMQLMGNRLDDWAFETLCRQTGRSLELIRRLIAQGRIDEAIREADKADTHDLIKAADLLVRQRHAPAAKQLIQRRLQTDGPHETLDAWLQRLESTQRTLKTRIELIEKLFQLKPDIDLYRRLRVLGRQRGTWHSQQNDLLANLELDNQTELLIAIHLDENHLDRALERIASSETSSIGWGQTLLVAQAAERSHPLDAAELYMAHVERLLSHPIDDDHREVRRTLSKIHTLTLRTGGEQAWIQYLANLRSRHQTRAGLLKMLDSPSFKKDFRSKHSDAHTQAPLHSSTQSVDRPMPDTSESVDPFVPDSQ